jgi:hypothetical protein
MGVTSDQALGNFKMIQQLLGVAGVLAGDHIHAFQRLYSTVGDILKVPYRCRHHK